MTYQYQEYPKAVSRPSEDLLEVVQIVVKTPEEKKEALVDGWFDDYTVAEAERGRRFQALVSGSISELLPHSDKAKLIDRVFKARFDAAEGAAKQRSLIEYRDNFLHCVLDSPWAARLIPLIPTHLDADRSQPRKEEPDHPPSVDAVKSKRQPKVYKTATGRNIDRLRKECGWTIDNLAEQTRQNRKTVISHINKGARPRPGTFHEYATAFSDKLGRNVLVSEIEGAG